LGKRSSRSDGSGSSSGATVGYESELWQMADALRGSMDAAEYKHVVLGLIFLKFISDAFEERHERLKVAVDDPKNEYYVAPSTRNRSESIARLLEELGVKDAEKLIAGVEG